MGVTLIEGSLSEEIRLKVMDLLCSQGRICEGDARQGTAIVKDREFTVLFSIVWRIGHTRFTTGWFLMATVWKWWIWKTFAAVTEFATRVGFSELPSFAAFYNMQKSIFNDCIDILLKDGKVHLLLVCLYRRPSVLLMNQSVFCNLVVFVFELKLTVSFCIVPKEIN